MKVYCDKCNKDFEINAKEKKYADGIVELYFKCPHCKERYTSFFTNKNIRQKQMKIRKLYEQYGKEVDEHKIIKLLEQIDELKKEIGNDMNILKNKMLNSR